jgi:SAM-dependent methyltransferase
MRATDEMVSEALRRTREFFASRAATWEHRFPDDAAAYAAAAAEMHLQPGQVVVDLGCGTGRALPFLRSAVGASGAVVAVDATPEMLQVAREKGRGEYASLMVADVNALPLGHGSVDAFLAAGLLTHVDAPLALLRALAATASPGARLAVFHPIGRAALARRHGRELRHDELLDPRNLPAALSANGWELATIDDGEHRYLAIATRTAHAAT